LACTPQKLNLVKNKLTRSFICCSNTKNYSRLFEISLISQICLSYLLSFKFSFFNFFKLPNFLFFQNISIISLNIFKFYQFPIKYFFHQSSNSNQFFLLIPKITLSFTKNSSSKFKLAKLINENFKIPNFSAKTFVLTFN